MTKAITFKTQMKRTGANTTGVVVPSETVSELGGGARPAVVAEINGYAYRTTIGVMKGLSMLPFSAQHREASGIGGGDPVTVALRLDTESRSVVGAKTPETRSRRITALLTRLR